MVTDFPLVVEHPAQANPIIRAGVKTAERIKNVADLLAIGAFAHSRLREAISGGVTHSSLDKARLPILFSR